jgi:drug/metabolite transporter (DMT)-like permease
MALGVMAALAGALSWTLASGLWRRLPTSLGPAGLNLLKNLLALGLLLPLLPWLAQPLAPQQAVLLLASGVLGIAAGDSFYFAALRRLGTRRTLTLEAGGPVLTSAAGMVLLLEVPSPRQWFGVALVCLALLLVAGQAPPGDRRGRLQRQQGLGLGLGLLALACSSAGALLARAALRATPLPPLQAAALRLGGAVLVMLPLLPGLGKLLRRRWGPRPAQVRWLLLLAATLLGTVAGIALQQLALAQLPVGLAVSLLSTSPVMAVLLAGAEGDRPGWRGWLAALLVLAGMALLLLQPAVSLGSGPADQLLQVEGQGAAAGLAGDLLKLLAQADQLLAEGVAEAWIAAHGRLVIEPVFQLLG